MFSLGRLDCFTKLLLTDNAIDVVLVVRHTNANAIVLDFKNVHNITGALENSLKISHSFHDII